tara:strand:- start:301 stop:828 length:528 start_codon:yes stop_codon:yes gene_type:complete
MTQQFKHDIETKGFYKLSEQEALDLIRIDEFRLLNTEERSRDNGQSDVNPELAERLQTFGQYLKFKYILPNWPDAEYNKFIVWDGVDKDNQGWHTDMFEDYDIFFLYYFDNSEPKTGGAINFKWGSLDGDPQTAAYYPKAGDLFAVSNHRGFWHKAESTSITRRVASFDFTTEKD